jgi:hypothetical protein
MQLKFSIVKVHDEPTILLFETLFCMWECFNTGTELSTKVMLGQTLVLMQMTFLNNVRKVGRLVLSRTSCLFINEQRKFQARLCSISMPHMTSLYTQQLSPLKGELFRTVVMQLLNIPRNRALIKITFFFEDLSLHNVRFEVSTAARRRRMMMFWVLAPCRLVSVCQRFGETYCLHLQG